ncbi:Aste57867_20426 [Aphanomyces stellatus]|uniref:Aste57867_20426 protein n=1 Tax=Aphanomyces stellatus TaxID=120398 RepID=A0A485LGY6_9STRA|nr:hypothetical protein As57867_020360 [Aphanomyces stellatus]VFT97112.1 Aste57867_20426 [Aphanomyces stellatus]
MKAGSSGGAHLRRKTRPQTSDGREGEYVGKEDAYYQAAPLPKHVEEKGNAVADDKAAKDSHDDHRGEEVSNDDEQSIVEGLMPSAPTNGRTGPPQVPSAYMTRHSKFSHMMGLSPIEELKLAQGEFQAKAAMNLHGGHMKLPKLSLTSVRSSMSNMVHPHGENSPPPLLAPPPRKKSMAAQLIEKLKSVDNSNPSTSTLTTMSTRLPDEDIRRISRTLNKNIEDMTAQQALNFVQDALQSENILKQKSHELKVRKLPWYLVHPMGKFRQRWDIASLAFLLYTAIFIPLQLSYADDLDMATLSRLDLGIDIFYMIDLCVNCVSTYEVRGHVERNVKKIIKQYLRSWFVPDVVASIPFNVINFYYPNMNDNLRLFKLLRLSRFARVFNRLEYSLLVRSTVSSLVKFALLVLLTCGFYKVSSGDPVGWAAKMGMPSLTLYDKYVTSSYWAVMTMTTVGYGDVASQTTRERLWSIFAMVNGAWIFAYGITNVVSMVSNLNSSDTEFQIKMDYVNKYMETRDLPLKLRSEIREFFFNTRITVETKLKNESKILGELSALLRSKVALAINDSVLNKMPFFEGADHNFLMELALSMKMVCLPPHEEVIMEGEIGEEMFFIFRGAVEVLKAKVQVAVLGEKQYFGEMAILNKNCLRTASVVTLCFCELRMLTREKFLLALTHYPGMRQRIAKIVHRRNQRDSTRNLAPNTDVAHRGSTLMEKVAATILEQVTPSSNDKSMSGMKLAPILSEASMREPREAPLLSIHNLPTVPTPPTVDEGGAADETTAEDEPIEQTTGAVDRTTEINDIIQTSFLPKGLDQPPAESAHQCILDLIHDQEVLLNHVTAMHTKWRGLQRGMRRMQKELHVYRRMYGAVTLPTEADEIDDNDTDR